MKEVITALTAVAGATLLWRKGKITLGAVLLVLILAASGICYCLLQGFSGQWIPINAVERGEKGSSDRQMEFQVQIEDTDKQVTLDIPARELDQEEAEAQLSALLQRLDQEILGDNSSLTEICYPLRLLSVYPDSPVQLQWQTDSPDYLSWEGELGSGIPEEGAEVLLRGELRLQECKEVYQRRLYLYPSKAIEDLPGRIQEEARKLNRDGEEETYYLPETIDDKTIQWYLVSDSKGWLLICLALMMLGAQVLAQQQKGREKYKKRAEQLDKEYAELVSRIQMLLGAGLSMRKVLERIALEYKDSQEKEKQSGWKRKRKKSLVNEEILICCRELENGLSEAEVYRRLGNRCGTSSYRGLSLLLEQNMTKGGQGLMQLLEREALEAFESRQRRARQEGEKVSVRLLLPMGIMLMIVLALIMIPAFMTM